MSCPGRGRASILEWWTSLFSRTFWSSWAFFRVSKIRSAYERSTFDRASRCSSWKVVVLKLDLVNIKNCTRKNVWKNCIRNPLTKKTSSSRLLKKYPCRISFFFNLEHIRWRKLMPPGHSTSLQTRTVWDKKIQKVGEKSQVLSAPFGSWLVFFINRPRTINLCFPKRKGHIPDFNVSNSPQKPNKSMQNPPSIPKANWPLARNKNGYLGDSGSFHFG